MPREIKPIGDYDPEFSPKDQERKFLGLMSFTQEFPEGTFILVGNTYAVNDLMTMDPQDVTETRIMPRGSKKSAIANFVDTSTGMPLKFKYNNKDGIMVYEFGTFVPIIKSKAAESMVGSPVNVIESPETPSKPIVDAREVPVDAIFKIDGDTATLASLKPFSSFTVAGLDSKDYTLGPYDPVPVENISKATFKGSSQVLALYDSVKIQATYASTRAARVGKYAIQFPSERPNDPTNALVVTLINDRKKTSAKFLVRGFVIKDIETGTANIYVSGTIFNKRVYTEEILSFDPDYMKYLEDLFGSTNAARLFLNKSNREIIDKPNGGTEVPNGSERPQEWDRSRPEMYSDNLNNYLRNLSSSLPARSVLKQESALFGKPDIKPPDTKDLQRPPQKTIIQKFGIIIIGLVAGGFGAAYYGKNKSDFISDPQEREDIKTEEDIRAISKESMITEQAALQAYQAGGLGLEVAKQTAEANEEIIEELQNK
jgi:hypothetical protein